MGSSAVTGLVVAAAVLAVATVLGLWHSRRDGRLRPVADSRANVATPRVAEAAAGAEPPRNAATALNAEAGRNAEPARTAGPARNAEAGRSAEAAGNAELTRSADAAGLPSDDRPATLAVDDAHDAAGQTLRDLGVDPATPVTLVQFSSAFCAPCRVTRRVLADVAGLVDGVRHLEVDAESHLDAVRALDIWRTPTTLVVAGDRIIQRASGVPAKAQVLTAVAPLLDRAA